jgi:ankyrin repeat protein
MMSQTFPVKRNIVVNWKHSEHGYNTALHQATKNSHMNCMLVLLRCQGIDVNVQNAEGQTPLHVAIKNGNVQCAHLLLQRGAKHEIKDANGDTAISLSVKLAEDGCCKLLVEFGADVSVEYDPNLAAMHRQSMLKKKKEVTSMPKYDKHGFVIDPSKAPDNRVKLNK